MTERALRREVLEGHSHLFRVGRRLQRVEIDVRSGMIDAVVQELGDPELLQELDGLLVSELRRVLRERLNLILSLQCSCLGSLCCGLSGFI